MQHRLNHLFAQLKWYEALEFSAMALYVISISIHWRTGIWALFVLALCAIVKGVASRQVGNPALTRTSRICLLQMVLFFSIYLFSILYSNSPFGGLIVSGKKLSLLILSCFFLLSDLSYIQRKHISALSLLLAATLTLRFSIMLVQAILNMMTGISFDGVVLAYFDPMHYNYLALYIITALILLFFETMRYWKSPQWHTWRWLLIADMLIMVEYTLTIGSRSGLLSMVLVAATIGVYLVLSKNFKIGIIVMICFTLFLGLNRTFTPKLFSRATQTIEKMEDGKDGDIRIGVWKCGLELVKGHELFGYGNDGYWVELKQKYVEHDIPYCYHFDKHNFHNQYLETLVATGIIGLLILIAMITLPVIFSMTRKHWNPAMVIFTVLYASWIFFEEGFSRQMGLLFICWWYGVLISFPKHYPAPLVDIPFLHKRHTPEA